MARARWPFATRVTAWRSTSKGAQAARLRARAVVLAGGLRPQLPGGVVETARQFHNHELLEQDPEVALDHGTVGSSSSEPGQSAAEVTDYLHTTFPDAEVHGVFAKYGYSPADDSPYANRVFDPAAVDDFYTAEPDRAAAAAELPPRHQLLVRRPAADRSALCA